MRVHPLCSESVRKMAVLVGVVADEGAEAVGVANCAAAERGALLLALARDVSLPTVAAVDGTNDRLDDLLAASTRGWSGKFKLRGVKLVKPRVFCKPAASNS